MAEVAVIPIGTESLSLSEYVKRAVEVLEERDIEHELTSTGTVLEGDLDEVMDTIEEMHENVFGEDVSRVVTSIEIDDRRDKPVSIVGKKSSVEEKLE